MKTLAVRMARYAGVLGALALAPQAAQATATLEASIVEATCTVTEAGGASTVVPCSADSWIVALQPGWSAQMVATVEYAYADDGLPLARPQGITMIAHAPVREVFYEAGALYVLTSSCYEYYCETGRPWQQRTGHPNYYPPVFISDNEAADSLSGTLTVTVGAHFDDVIPFYASNVWSPNIFVGLNSLSTLTFSGDDPVTAVPEPSTLVLMLMGLGALGSAAFKRARAPSVADGPVVAALAAAHLQRALAIVLGPDSEAARHRAASRAWRTASPIAGPCAPRASALAAACVASTASTACNAACSRARGA